jgi:cytochrome c oxidase subunit IV
MSVPASQLHRPRTYGFVLAALLFLTALTILVSYVDLGPFSTPIAFIIAAVKATLVVLFFMHMREAHGVLWLAALAGFFWLAILIVLTMSDFATRGFLPIPGK